MSMLDGLRHRVYVLWRGERYGREVERELHFHVELERLAASHDHSATDAELAARRAMGNTTYYREEVRRMTPLAWLDVLRQDVAYAWRGLRRSPGFTAAVFVTLSLGIGVNAAIFGFLDQLFVRPPSGVAVPGDVSRLYMEVSRPHEPSGHLTHDSFTYPLYRAVRAAEDSAVNLAAFTAPDSTVITAGDGQTPVRRSLVTGTYFSLLGVRPERGRFFSGDEALIETPTPVIVLSDAAWRRAYHADESIVGKTISIRYHPFTVIGVAPPAFTGVDLDAVDVWVPANNYRSGGSSGTNEPWYDTFQNSFRVVARIPPAYSVANVLGAATVAARSVHLAGFEYDSTEKVLAGPINRAAGPSERQREVSISTRLAGVALIVLLIACANVANLLVVRATQRRREIALRRALGVSRSRLWMQMVSESLVLSTLGGAGAVLFALWTGAALRRLLLPNVHWAGAAIDTRSILFVAAVCVVTGVAAGLAPAFQSTHSDLVNSLRAGSHDGAYQGLRLRSALLVLQTALAVVLLAGAGLFVRSLDNVRAIDMGFDVDHTMLVSPSFATSNPTPQEIAAGLDQAAQQLRSTHEVDAVGLASVGPMTGFGVRRVFLPDRDSLPRFGDERAPSFVAVSPGYFRAAGSTLIAGRDFDARDEAKGGQVLIVSQAMARTYWPNQSPLGKCVMLDKREAPCAVVVGEVADVHRMAVIEKPSMQLYTPLAQAGEFWQAQTLVLRTSERTVGTTAKLATQQLARAFPHMTPPRIRLMSDVLAPQLRPWRIGAQLFAALGLLALMIAAIGVYSVIAHAVAQRFHEMGVRIALGARLHDLFALVLGQAARVVLLGAVAGVAAALAAGRLVAALLFGVSARDPIVLAGAAITLLVVGLLAGLVPAWRAAKVDPVTALRAE
ncbi:MAG TPA: ADOP family duplicated permease [Gemmatimonadaceae bacterium]|nr:ADOP family duplicated permease [Gemmatimonadaceae bacterium]